MQTPRFAIGAASLVRVAYADVVVDAAVVGLTREQISSIDWATPVWADGPAQVRVGAAIWVIESEGRRIVVDPAQAADAILRSGPEAEVHQQAVAAVLDGAGYPRESIDTVITSHIDGIGMIAWRDAHAGWRPFFPNAEVLVSRREYEAIADAGAYRPQGSDALLDLHTQGVVTTVDDQHVVTSEVATRWTGAHSPGHQIVRVASRGVEATMLGHLALTPVHCALAEHRGHMDPPAAARALQSLLDRPQLLVGPLWPAPGAGRWTGHDMRPEAPVVA